MTVPGVFFDVNPGKQRSGPSPYAQWIRFSFGPPIANVADGSRSPRVDAARVATTAAVELRSDHASQEN